MRAEAEDSRALDGLMYDILPEVSIEPGSGAIWDRNMVTLPFKIKNSGAMPVRIEIDIWWQAQTYQNGDASLLPTTEQLSSKICSSAFYLKPNEYISCDVIIFANGANFDHTYTFEYRFILKSRTDLDPEMRTYQQLLSNYSEVLIKNKSNRQTSATGFFTRPLGWTPPTR
jgi:hypothetical protein